MRIASYTATRPGIRGLFNLAVRWWLTSPYSHTELVFSDGACFSCSWLDGGPRLKRIELRPDHWDLAPVPAHYSEAQARAAAEAMCAAPKDERVRYSLKLLAAFVVQPLLRRCGPRDEVCSTAILRVLGVPEHRRYDPMEAALLLTREA